VTTFDLTDDTVVVVIGSGAGGGTLSNELAQKGVKVVCLEAGQWLDYTEDFVNDEWTMFERLTWQDKRTSSGTWQVAKDFPELPAWICKTVGGTTTHWAGVSIRFQEHEFRTKTVYGNIPGANLLDWPLGLNDLAPFYDRAEDKLGVTRTHGIPGLPGNNNFKVMEAGARKLGYKSVHTGYMAINSEPRNGRTSCRQLGFCLQGCRMGAKWSTLHTEIPEAEATSNFELRPNAQVLKIEHSLKGKITAVVYDDGNGNLQRQKARVVCVAGNSIESPRLLLNSASNLFPDGLANSSGQVGRNYMRHTSGAVFGVFEKPVNMYRGTTMAGIIEDEAIHDPSRGFVGGYELETVSLGLPFYSSFLDPSNWGKEVSWFIDRFDCTAAMSIIGEDMPQMSNRISLHPKHKDQFGLPVPNVHYDDHENDSAMREHAYKQGARIYEAIGAIKVKRAAPLPATHNMGTNRMSTQPQEGVVNKWGQCHDVDNLFVSDGSQFTTGGTENPTLTIVALAIRQAEYLSNQLKKNNI
jgi:choline dehydrogenase-like flavoprotein